MLRFTTLWINGVKLTVVTMVILEQMMIELSESRTYSTEFDDGTHGLSFTSAVFLGGNSSF
jgi:hypothetical protein